MCDYFTLEQLGLTLIEMSEDGQEAILDNQGVVELWALCSSDGFDGDIDEINGYDYDGDIVVIDGYGYEFLETLQEAEE